MKNFFKQMHRHRIFSISIWSLIVIIAVILMPSIQQTSNNSYQINNPNQKQIDQATKLQNKWGNNLNNTDQVYVVYNNPNGKITDKQQNNIYHSISKLQNSQNEIKKITSLKTTPSAENRLISEDKSTEIIVLNIDKSIVQNSTYANKLRTKFAAPGLANYVTNQNIINNVNSTSIMKKTILVGTIIFVLAALFIGLAFRSLVTPLILTFSNLISFLASISLISLMVNYLKLSFSYYLPMTILLSTTLISSLISFFIYYRFEKIYSDEENQIKTVKKVMRHITYRISMICVVLLIAFGSLFFIKYSPIQAFSLISVSTLITTLGSANITAFFLQILGKAVYFPRESINNQKEHKFWNKLSNFSLWQPIAGIILTLYIICPFALSYRSNVTYNLNNNEIANDQSIIGKNLVNLHFNEGKSTPVTIYIKNDQKFNNANTLLSIDNLTNKLQANSEIKNVYSVTQPGGAPIEKYQLNNQLESINKNISTAQSNLSSSNKSISNDVKNINPKNLNTQIKKLNQNRINLTELTNNISNTQTGISGSISNVSSAQSIKINKKQKKKLKKYLNELNQALNSSIEELSSLQNSISSNSSNSSNQEVALKKYYHKLNKTKTSLNKANSSVEKSNKSIKEIAKYLENIQKTDAAKVYYITPEQIEDTDFYQSMYNFNSEDQKTTVLEINFKKSPDQINNLNRIKELKNQVNESLKGSRIQNSDIAYDGIPVNNAAMQHDVNKFTVIVIGLFTIILWIGLMIVSRSILHPLYWVATFVISSLAGLQITQMILSYLTKNPLLDSNSIFFIIVPLLILATAELIPLASSYRKDNPNMMNWLFTEINNFGQKIRYFVLGTILISISLLFSNLNSFAYVSLVSIITTILFNISLPLLATALGKLSIKLPQGKLNDWLTKKNK